MMRIPEGEEGENVGEEVFDVNMAKGFPKLMKDTKAQIQETQRTTSSIDTKKSTPRHIIFKQQEIKNKENLERRQR